jgi:alkylation response protein AidB-like acyl-CoA dehydrogenase
MTVPTHYGGLGLDLVSMAIVFEEISRAWMGVAGILGSHSLAARMIAQHGTQEQRNDYLPSMATGERRTAIALTEPDAGSDLQGIKTVARKDGSDYVIRGTKIWITNARFADPLPVLVKTDPDAEPPHRGMSVLLVEKGSPGFKAWGSSDTREQSRLRCNSMTYVSPRRPCLEERRERVSVRY